MNVLALPLLAALAPASSAADLEAEVKRIFDESCTMCHSAGGDPTDPGQLDLESSLGGLVGRKSVMVDALLVAPGDPEASVLMHKLHGGPKMKGGLMPEGGDPLPKAQIDAIGAWIASLPATAAPAPSEPAAPEPRPKPFHGTEQVVLPTTTTLGKNNLQYRIDHRFGRIGTERGALGMDAGVVMSMGLQYGIFDGWDVRVRRSNSKKAWEISSKYVPVRQESGKPLSLGFSASLDLLRDFDVANRVAGDFQMMLSRLWLGRWATMVTVGYHLRTDHNPRPMVDYGHGAGPILVEDTRDTLDVGLASSVYLGKRKRWGIDLEWIVPIPGGRPNRFYYRGGDADPNGSKIGAWSLGGSYYTGKHFFQVFFTNNREIHYNLAAPGGQSGNPFSTPGVETKNPFNRFNFFLGFNLGRTFALGGRTGEPRKKKRKKASTSDEETT